MSDQYKPKGIIGLPLEVAADGEGILTSFQPEPRRAIVRLMDTRLEYMSHEEREAWSRYLVHAANEYPKAIEALRQARIFAKIRNDLSMRVYNRPVTESWVEAADAVLSAAREVEGGK